jgi:hypothetical protein
MATKDYVLGRGGIYFNPFTAGTQVLSGLGERLFGNCPTVKLTTKGTMLDHYSSLAGIKELDDSTLLQVERTGSLVCDDIQYENLALWFLGNKVINAQSGLTAQSDGLLTGVAQDRTIQLGTSLAPQGVRNVSNVVVRNQVASSGATTYSLGTDYTLDAARARVYIIPGGAINGAFYAVFDVAASSRTSVVSGNVPIEGQLRYVAANPKGINKDFFCPWVLIEPDSDFDLIGDSWQQVTFNFEIKTLGTNKAIYLDGPAT